jgi:hypothetical protein
MNDKFDELAKGMAQSVTRRAALKKFGVGLASLALASLGLADNAQGRRKGCRCKKPPYFGCDPADYGCIEYCGICCGGGCF